MKRDESGFIRRTADEEIDPAVAASLGRAQQRQAESKLTPKQREKKRKQRAKNEANQERRMDLLIDVEMKEWVTSQAEQLHCTSSQVVEFALRYLRGGIEGGQVDLKDYLSPTQHPFYWQRLSYPGDEK